MVNVGGNHSFQTAPLAPAVPGTDARYAVTHPPMASNVKLVQVNAKLWDEAAALVRATDRTYNLGHGSAAAATAATGRAPPSVAAAAAASEFKLVQVDAKMWDESAAKARARLTLAMAAANELPPFFGKGGLVVGTGVGMPGTPHEFGRCVVVAAVESEAGSSLCTLEAVDAATSAGAMVRYNKAGALAGMISTGSEDAGQFSTRYAPLAQVLDKAGCHGCTLQHPFQVGHSIDVPIGLNLGGREGAAAAASAPILGASGAIGLNLGARDGADVCLPVDVPPLHFPFLDPSNSPSHKS